jgi:hypothetical protein
MIGVLGKKGSAKVVAGKFAARTQDCFAVAGSIILNPGPKAS